MAEPRRADGWVARVEVERIGARVAALVPGYLERRIEDVASLRAAREAGDRARIAAIAHNLRGTGAGYGCPWLSEMGARLEEAARGDWGTVTRLILDLQRAIDEARRSLQADQRSR